MYDYRSHDYVVHDRRRRYESEAEAERIARAYRGSRRRSGIRAAVGRVTAAIAHARNERVSAQA
jgi:hypothetical protein